jgi:hypothetical protein
MPSHEKGCEESGCKEGGKKVTKGGSPNDGPDSLDKCMRDKVAVALNACDNAAKHYDDYYKSFTALDGKAQATAAVSGLVLAAIAAFAKDGRASVLVSSGYGSIVVVLGAPIAALTSVIICLFGARVTEVVVPFDSPEQIREAKNLTDLDCDEFSQEHVVNYYRARLEHWITALESIESVVKRKACWILGGQIAMIASLVFLLVLYTVTLLKS